MSGFRAYLAMVRNSFTAYFRDTGSLFWGLAFPILLMVLLGMAMGGGGTLNLTVSVVDEVVENGGEQEAADLALHEILFEGLAELDGISVVEESREEALEALRDGERSAVVVVPRNPLPLTVTVYTDETRPEVGQAALAATNSLLAAVNQELTGPAPLQIAREAVSPTGTGMGIFDFLLPGVVAMTIMFTGLMGLAWSVTELRSTLALKRLLTSPAHPMTLMGGLLSRFTAVDLFQAGVLIAVGVLFFDATVAGHPAHLALIAVIGSLTFVAMGLAVSTLSGTTESANNLANVIGFPMLFLSGVFWPKEMMPDVMQPFINLLPLTHLVDAMRYVAVHADSVMDHIGSLAYLALWGVAAVSVAAWRFRWE